MIFKKSYSFLSSFLDICYLYNHYVVFLWIISICFILFSCTYLLYRENDRKIKCKD
ncbi:hypothetical protein BACPLE_01113 [Phocaeicola plebeius DSM 17135]|uniref:Uncharacterized protein n=1 Tax=Phocaeicola plebeius (strain DSM 17135 / JCM 12973 / CCUG 54634 / M2) TaxID=484018 RepID=B5CWM3_PHOPM|nr:hypothetical protein BACPLE_01113 [Phocaeicola plebeius DSM 17135]